MPVDAPVDAPVLPPYPYAGGKRTVAQVIWDAFGNVPTYVEPFLGSGSVLLQRPRYSGREIVNDMNAYIANFFRAVKADVAGVIEYAAKPITETDLIARQRWLVTEGVERLRQMENDPEFHDAKVAGYWVYGMCTTIGPRWCNNGNGNPSMYLAAGGMGIYRTNTGTDYATYLRALSHRLRDVNVLCGDWRRVLGPTPTTANNQSKCAVLLDSPYDLTDRERVYLHDSNTIAAEVAEWARVNGENPLMRICLCSYGEFETFPGWRRVRWKANGGFANQGSGQGRINANRECLDFSPACLNPKSLIRQTSMFEDL